MAGGLHGFERPPRWAIVVMVLGAAWLVVGSFISRTPAQPQASTSPAGNPLVTTNAGAATGTAVVEIVGDSYTGGSGQGGNGPNGWPSLMYKQVTADGYSVQVRTYAAGGSGYVAKGPSGKSFDDLVNQGSRGVTLFVFFGSRNDGPAGVQPAASQAFRDALTASPTAKLLVIGPPFTNDNPPASFLANRDAVKAAAAGVGAFFVDPLAQDWFGGQFHSLIGSDGVHPTDAGHGHMAQLITPNVEQALTAAGLTKK